MKHDRPNQILKGHFDWSLYFMVKIWSKSSAQFRKSFHRHFFDFYFILIGNCIFITNTILKTLLPNPNPYQVLHHFPQLQYLLV